MDVDNQFGKGYAMHDGYDIRLKENFKLFISGPSRCGKTVFVSKLLENIHTHLQKYDLLMCVYFPVALKQLHLLKVLLNCLQWK